MYGRRSCLLSLVLLVLGARPVLGPAPATADLGGEPAVVQILRGEPTAAIPTFLLPLKLYLLALAVGGYPVTDITGSQQTPTTALPTGSTQDFPLATSSTGR